MLSPYISRVQIKNFRNFLNADVSLTHKQVIIGENNVGKSNFLKAIQLILDPSLSDRDRQLNNSDFHDSIENPTKNGESIEISVEIRGYEQSNQLLAILSDGVISDAPPTVKITYLYAPIKDDQNQILRYQYQIYFGDDPQKPFRSIHRNYLNFQVIKALRDVEREMKSLKNSPIFQLIDQYDIKDEELEKIAEELNETAESIMKLDELIELRGLIQDKFKLLSGTQPDCEINLSTFDIDPIRLLQALQVLMGGKRRPVSAISLGLCNILYISLMLLLLRDRTVPTIIKADKWVKLLPKDSSGLLNKFYTINDKGNYILNQSLIQDQDFGDLYSFMNRNYFPNQFFTILAVEEPEAHLHPVLQRLIYREVLQKSETSVIFTTHSTHITSVAPINSIVHLLQNKECNTELRSTATLSLNEKDYIDLERFLDARRSELYFGSGVILVEGIAEEYLIPVFANLLGYSLDSHRVVVCNINSTNFTPYVKLLQELNINWCLITDGDYYELDGEKREYQKLATNTSNNGYLGLENVNRILSSLAVFNSGGTTLSYAEQYRLFAEKGCFIGKYTLEVDMMEQGGIDGREVFKKIFSELRTGGDRQQQNFESVLDSGDYWKALDKIEGKDIGKGRFAQRLASNCINTLIPQHAKKAIEYIIDKVKIADE